MSLTIIEDDAFSSSTSTLTSKSEQIPLTSDKEPLDFTLINLIIGFYRNCYDKSTKPPEQSKLIQLLSCECIGAFVEIIYAVFQVQPNDQPLAESVLCQSVINKKLVRKMIDTRSLTDSPELSKAIEQEAVDYYEKFSAWLANLLDNKNSSIVSSLDSEIKHFCLGLLNGLESKKLVLNSSNKLYATTYFTIYKVLKSCTELNSAINLTNFKFEEKSQSHKEYFMYRVLMYGDLDDYSKTHSASDSRVYFKNWLGHVYDLSNSFRLSKDLTDLFAGTNDKKSEQSSLHLQFSFVLKQMDSLTRLNLKASSSLSLAKSPGSETSNSVNSINI
jgi:hypothetical protein